MNAIISITQSKTTRKQLLFSPAAPQLPHIYITPIAPLSNKTLVLNDLCRQPTHAYYFADYLQKLHMAGRICNHSPGRHNRSANDSDPCQNNCASSNPNIVFDNDSRVIF